MTSTTTQLTTKTSWNVAMFAPPALAATRNPHVPVLPPHLRAPQMTSEMSFDAPTVDVTDPSDVRDDETVDGASPRPRRKFKFAVVAALAALVALVVAGVGLSYMSVKSDRDNALAEAEAQTKIADEASVELEAARTELVEVRTDLVSAEAQQVLAEEAAVNAETAAEDAQAALDAAVEDLVSAEEARDAAIGEADTAEDIVVYRDILLDRYTELFNTTSADEADAVIITSIPAFHGTTNAKITDEQCKITLMDNGYVGFYILANNLYSAHEAGAYTEELRQELLSGVVTLRRVIDSACDL